MLDLAIRAAREAGEVLRSSMGRDFEVMKKGPIDLVTEVDKACEELIKGLTASAPGDAVLAEERHAGGAPPNSAGWSTRSTAR